MSDLSNSDDFGDTSGFYRKRREGLGNFFIGLLTGIALSIGVLLILIWAGGPESLPFLAAKAPPATATLEATMSYTPSLTFTPTEETPSVTPTPSCGSKYEIKSGDTLDQISKTCGVTVEAILGLNPELDPDVLIPGTEILLPPPGTGFTPSAIPSNQPVGSIITVRSVEGDTLESIAAKCQTTLDDLISRNKDTLPEDINNIPVGLVLQCKYGIATQVPTRLSPTYGPTPTLTPPPTEAITPTKTTTPTVS
jgi:LysM repeat protein